MEHVSASVIRQHLIDPEICIRCNTCELTCPVGAISHDARNYVVDAEKCNLCMACVPPCPTGSIDNWRTVPRADAYSVEAQFDWEALPPELSAEELAAAGVAAVEAETEEVAIPRDDAAREGAFNVADYAAIIPPWSAAHPYANLYGPRAAEKSITATVVGNVRVTEVGKEYDTHHIVLDFGAMPFPLLEGQSIGIIPPGTDAEGRRRPRQYSIASPRNGERPGYNNASLMVKRVVEDHQGRRVRGVVRTISAISIVGDRSRRSLAPSAALPDAQSPALRHRDDLHRYGQCADAGDDRMASAPACLRQVRGRQTDAVLRRAHPAGSPVFRPAAEFAEGFY